jgi:hypothetical protein
MAIRFHTRANERMKEQGTTEDEVKSTVAEGEQFPVKFNRTGFRCNFFFDSKWRGKHYRIKQVEAYAVQENTDWIFITVITRYF